MLNEQEYTLIKEQIDNKIKEYNTIIIHRHIRPDGDAVGSALGLREILRSTFPNKKVLCPSLGLPEYLKFVGKEDEVSESDYEGALVIAVDTANKDRICGDNFSKAKEVIKIDHHIPVENYGVLNLVREEYGSCSLVIMEMCLSLGYIITKESAKYLYLAVVTDTGRFRFKEVDGKALELAGKMIDYGFDTQEMYANLYTKDKETYKLNGYVYSHIKYTENGVSYFFMTKRLMKKFKVNIEDASNCVSLMDSTKGSMIWLLFIEHDDAIRVRLRSRFIPIDKLANKYHGGGHENACGSTIYNKKEFKNLLKDADQILKEFKQNNGDKF